MPCSIGAWFARRDLATLNLTRVDMTMRWLANRSTGYIIGGRSDVLLDGGYIIPFRGAIALDHLPRKPTARSPSATYSQYPCAD